MTTSNNCAACKGAVVTGDPFCAACGAKAVPSSSSGARGWKQREHHNRARRWLLLVAGLTAGTGILFYLIDLMSVDPEYEVTLTRQARLPLITSLMLGLFYLGMWRWAARHVLAAAVTSLLGFVASLALNAAIDPFTLVHGLITKVMCSAVLISSLWEALAARAAGRTP